MVEPARIRVLLGMVFLQMLPATLVVPAIRPLFAAHHAGSEGAMQAFSALNMLGAAVAAPVVGAWIDRGGDVRRLLAILALLDAALLFAVSQPLATHLVLVLRTLEGAAHVGGATLLLAEAAALAKKGKTAQTMGMFGAAIIFAIALGNGLGTAALALGTSGPFLVGAGLATLTAMLATVTKPVAAARDRAPSPLTWGLLRLRRGLVVPVSAAFVGRFTVGCIIVTFALFCHRVHGLSDGHIGVLFTVLTTSFAIAMVPLGRLCASVAPSTVLGVGAIVYAIVLGTIGYVPPSLLGPWMVVAGAASGAIFAGTLVLAAREAAESRGSAMAWINAAGCLGMMLGPGVAGIVLASIGAEQGATRYHAVFGVAAGSVVLWLVLSLPWLRRHAASSSATSSAPSAVRRST